jgi:hypothetical protein
MPRIENGLNINVYLCFKFKLVQRYRRKKKMMALDDDNSWGLHMKERLYSIMRTLAQKIY